MRNNMPDISLNNNLHALRFKASIFTLLISMFLNYPSYASHQNLDTSIIYDENAMLAYVSEQYLKYCKVSESVQLPENIYITECTPNNDYMMVVNNGKHGLIDKSGQVTVPIVYDKVYVHNFGQEGLIRVKSGDKIGFVNVSGELVIPLMYRSVEDFSDGLATVFRDDKIGYINTNNELVIPYMYEYMKNDGSDFKGSITSVKIGEQYGVINQENEIVIPIEYDDIYVMEDEISQKILIRVTKNGKNGLFDQNGTVILPTIYQSIGYLSEDVINVENNEDKWAYFDTEGMPLTPFIYESTGFFNSGIAPVTLNGNNVYINTNNEIVNPERHSFFNDDVQEAPSSEQTGPVNHTVQTSLSTDYRIEELLSDDLAIAKVDRQYILVNSNRVSLSDRYDGMDWGRGDLIAVQKYPRVHFPRDMENNEIYAALINMKGDEIRRFNEGEYLFALKGPPLQGQFLLIDENEDEFAEVIDANGTDTGVYFEFIIP